jgi:hypothetical protein
MTTDTGTDISCMDGLVPSMPEVSGDLQIVQLAVRGLTKASDKLPFLGWGIDLRRALLSKYSTTQIEVLAKRQVLTDERLRACTVKAEQVGVEYQLKFALVKEDDGTELKFTMSIDEAAATLISLEQG